MHQKLKTKINQKHMHHLHKKLVTKNGWYAFWHVQMYHQHIQWTILALVVVMVGVVTVAQIKPGWLDSRNRSNASATAPELPRTYINSSVSTAPVTGQTINVPAGGDFQAALNSANYGDQIVLQAGATYTGNFTLPYKASGTGWITIRSSNMAGLPAEGTRVSPANASAMPKIITPATEPILSTAKVAAIAGSTVPAGVHNYRFMGIEFGVAAGVSQNYGLIEIGRGPKDYDANGQYVVPNQQEVNQLPYNIVFDRVYVHGNNTGNLSHGFALNGAATAIVDSYVANIHGDGYDTQAIFGFNGTGPYKIANNYLEGAGENILFGGSDAAKAILTPSDIEIRNNYVTKPLSWKPTSFYDDPNRGTVTTCSYGPCWTVKNLFELKNAKRVQVEGNIFQNNWVQGQDGTAILITVRNQDCTAPWSTVTDVTFSKNKVAGANNGFTVLAYDNEVEPNDPYGKCAGHPSYQWGSAGTYRVALTNNLFTDIGGPAWGTQGGTAIRLLSGSIKGGPESVTIDHNTMVQTWTYLVADGYVSGAYEAKQNAKITNNIFAHNGYALYGSNSITPGPTLTNYFPGIDFQKNVMAPGNAAVQGVTASSYGNFQTGNYFPTTTDWSTSGFADLTSYALKAGIYKNAGTDGKDLGADINALNTVLSGVVQGTSSGGVYVPPTIASKSHLNLNPASVSFSAVVGDPAPAAKTITLSNSGAASSSWASSSSGDWCHVTPLSGNLASGGSANLSVSVDAPDAAHVGTFPCTINIVDVNADNSPQSINISYAVTASPTSGDTVSPVVVLTTPANGATVSGNVAMSATATDNVIVDIVYFFIDDAYAGSDTTAPYTFSWNSTLVANGSHRVVAYGWDKSGNRGDSAIDTITVSNAPGSTSVTPSITSYSVTSKDSTSATITWTTSQPTVGSIKYGSVKTYLNLSAADGVSKTTHSITLTGLSAKSAYYYQIIASNVNGSATTSTSSFRTKPR